MRSNLSFFSFVPISLVSQPRNHCQIQCHRAFTLMFSSKSFIVLTLKFRSRIYFELIFYVWCEVGAQIDSFAYGWPVVSAPFVEKTVPSPLSCPLSQKSVNRKC